MLTVTQVFQGLVEVGSIVIENGIGPSSGMIFDQNLGLVYGQGLIQQGVDQSDIYLAANTIYLHCGRVALQRFCFEVEGHRFETPYDFENDELVRRGHPGLLRIGTMDIHALAQRGKQLGWQEGWCPFRGPAEALWRAGFKGIPVDSPQVAKAADDLGRMVASL